MGKSTQMLAKVAGFLVCFVVVVQSSPAWSRSLIAKKLSEVSPRPESAQESGSQIRVHKAGRMQFLVTNNGTFGYEDFFNPPIDPETGEPAVYCEYPAGSGVNHVFLGAIWIGAKVGFDTLVSTGHDGWWRVTEFYPEDTTASGITKRSRLPASPNYSPDAISDEDFLTTFCDTLTDPQHVWPDPFELRPHTPLGLRIEQESYAWGRPECDNFIIIKERITNIGVEFLTGVSFGVYLDADIGHSDYEAWNDDLTGTIDASAELGGSGAVAAYCIDNDGDPAGMTFDSRSARSAISVAVLQPLAAFNESFNWWLSNGMDPGSLDWGPVMSGNNHPLGTGGIGTPAGDKNKYFFMRNLERDYGSMWSNSNMTAYGWLPPNAIMGADLAMGTDIRFLLSHPLGTLYPGQSRELVFVIAMGDSVHRDPQNFDQHDPGSNPQAYLDGLDFSGLRSTLRSARIQYSLATQGTFGDANTDCLVNISDVVFLIGYIFASGEEPFRPDVADCNADCQVDLADAVYLINYIFGEGPKPIEGCAH